jgi:hypothetical protein
MTRSCQNVCQSKKNVGFAAQMAMNSIGKICAALAKGLLKT